MPATLALAKYNCLANCSIQFNAHRIYDPAMIEAGLLHMRGLRIETDLSYSHFIPQGSQASF